MVNKILDGLKIPANCSGIRVPIINEAVAKECKERKERLKPVLNEEHYATRKLQI